MTGRSAARLKPLFVASLVVPLVPAVGEVINATQVDQRLEAELRLIAQRLCNLEQGILTNLKGQFAAVPGTDTIASPNRAAIRDARASYRAVVMG